MLTCHDVAAYILNQNGAMTAVKLQKLLYYSQAWSLVWDDTPLFCDRIEAWVNGPVVADFYYKHRGEYIITSCTGDANALTKSQEDTVDAVLLAYGDKTSQWLSDLSHREKPWQKAREGLVPSERGTNEITLDSMLRYYSSISLS